MRALVPLFASAVLLPAQAPVDFAKEVAPILRDRCIACHGPQKQKGKLRLDAKAHVFPADQERWVVRPQDPEGSELLRRVRLPANDEDVMPNEGERLTAAQTAVLERWIAGGAVWPADGDALFVMAAPTPVPLPLPPLTEAQQQAVAAALAALTSRGLLAQRIAADTPAVDVNLSLQRDRAGDAELAALQPLQPVLVWLSLARTAVSDQGLAALAGCTQLRRLDLSNTAVGDAGLRHLAGLSRLEVLNLYGTKVTDQGLAALRPLAALRRLYLWQTAVSADAAAALQQALPQLQIDRGDYAEARQQAAAKAIAERDARNQPVNQTCPVLGKPVVASAWIEHDGLRIGFCCQDCLANFRKDPAKFADQVAAYKAAVKPPAK